MTGGTNYKPGDIVNGHILGGDNRWHPLPLPRVPPREPGTGKGLKIALGVIGGIIAIGVLGSLAEPPPDPAPAAAPEPAASPEPTAEPQPEEVPPGIGDPARDGKFEFVVTEVRTGLPSVGNDSWDYEEAQGAYTIVTMTVVNIGSEARTFTYSNQIGIDSQDRELDSDTAASWSVNDDVTGWLEDINPGNSITVNVVFDVAPGETLAAVELHDSSFSNGTRINLQ